MERDEMRIRISVRSLVEEMLLEGDLAFGGSTQRLLEGAQGHRAVQAEGGAINELPISGQLEQDGLLLTVHGRIDRLFQGPLPIIEEIKTTLRPLSSILEDDYPLHWAQAKVYAHLYCQKENLAAIQVRLCYFEIQTGDTQRFTRSFGREELKTFFLSLAQPFIEKRIREHKRLLRLREELKALPFPFEAYRPGQRELAAQVYLAIRDSERLLVQAPTGTGKTMAVLYPALKALGEDRCEKLFYLSARNTGKRAALDAVQRLAVPWLKCVELSAKAQLCPREQPDCAEGPCPYTLGYYDRLPVALDELFTEKGPYESSFVKEVALRHSLCPHEFSLDASLSCDLILCDYNYVFDPRVRLQRFFQSGRNRFSILLDEAHNLPSRGRDMYAESLCVKPLEALRKAVPRGNARKAPSYLALQGLLKLLKDAFEEEDVPFALEGPPPEELVQAVERVMGFLQEDAYPHAGDMGEISLMLSGFLYAASRWEDSMLRLYEGPASARVLRLFCRDASAFLQKDLSRCQSAVLFSATLTPSRFYKTLCGLKEEDRFISLPSPFPPENLCCLHLPVNTRYHFREQTLPQVAGAVAALVQSRAEGNFLAFCPSYAYLRQLLPLLEEGLPDVRLLVQEREMDDQARDRFLSGFSPEPKGRVLGLAVLGGVFAEGVDLPGRRLSGAAVIGVGLPQVSMETETLRAHYEETYQNGFAYAYVYPGLCRILQAAGRIIRSEKDRGALLLLDDRYGHSSYLQLLPPNWQLRRVHSLPELTKELVAFWSKDDLP